MMTRSPKLGCGRRVLLERGLEIHKLIPSSWNVDVTSRAKAAIWGIRRPQDGGHVYQESK